MDMLSENGEPIQHFYDNVYLTWKDHMNINDHLESAIHALIQEMGSEESWQYRSYFTQPPGYYERK